MPSNRVFTNPEGEKQLVQYVRDYPMPDLGVLCPTCHVPLNMVTVQCCPLCLWQRPKVDFQFERERCVPCGGYNVYDTANGGAYEPEMFCDDCQIFIEVTTEGNGDHYWDCYECGQGVRKEDPGEYEVICRWCH